METRPNILILFPDQWRWDWLGCETSPYGQVPVKTPHIDALAARGVRFSGCRSSSPLCAPARACLALGLRYHRCGVANNGHSTPTDRPTFFRLLRAGGYHTATCGKSDLFKPQKPPNPTGYVPIMDQLGFSDGIDHRGKGDAVSHGRKGIAEPYTSMLRQRGLLETHLNDHPESPLQRAAYPTPLPRDAYTDDFCGQNALKLLDRTPADKPWCLWVNFPGPHDPYDPPTEVLARYENVSFPPPVAPIQTPPPHRDPARDRVHYAACCSNIDDWVGRIIQFITQRGELDNTLIVFASDHGEMLGDHGRWLKSIWYEGSIRVPLIIAGRGVPIGEARDHPVELIDLAATILNAAGVDAPGDWDSRSLVPSLENPAVSHREVAVSQLGEWRCVTSNQWKLVDRQAGAPILYDLEHDPAELQDVAAQHPDRVASLMDQMEPWLT